jgi:hypothetical protein
MPSNTRGTRRISADYSDMIYAATREMVKARRIRKLRKWRLKRRAVADSLHQAGDRLFTFTCLSQSVVQRSHRQCDRAAARGVQTPDQNTDDTAIGGHRRHALLGNARLWPDQYAQG